MEEYVRRERGSVQDIIIKTMLACGEMGAYGKEIINMPNKSKYVNKACRQLIAENVIYRNGGGKYQTYRVVHTQKNLAQLKEEYGEEKVEWMQQMSQQGHYRSKGQDRRLRQAEVYAFLSRIDANINAPQNIPALLDSKASYEYLDPPIYVSYREIEMANKCLNQTAYARAMGALFCDRGSYAVYNMVKGASYWNYAGESKVGNQIARYATKHMPDSAKATLKHGKAESAILFCRDYELAYNYLIAPDPDERKNRKGRTDGADRAGFRPPSRYHKCYENTYIIPLTMDGLDSLYMLIYGTPRRLFRALNIDSKSVTGDAGRACDAVIDETMHTFFYSGDVHKLYYTCANRQYKKKIIRCFPAQKELVQDVVLAMGSEKQVTVIVDSSQIKEKLVE